MNPHVKRIHQLEKKRFWHLRVLLQSPSLLKGSLLNLKRPCGRSPCCCEQGELHHQTIVSFKKGGKTKFTYVPREDLPFIKGLSENMKRFRKNKKEMTLVEKKVWREIRRLERQITTHYKRS